MISTLFYFFLYYFITDIIQLNIKFLLRFSGYNRFCKKKYKKKIITWRYLFRFPYCSLVYDNSHYFFFPLALIFLTPNNFPTIFHFFSSHFSVFIPPFNLFPFLLLHNSTYTFTLTHSVIYPLHPLHHLFPRRSIAAPPYQTIKKSAVSAPQPDMRQ